MRAASAILIAIWAGACASRVAGPPQVVLDRSTCVRCGMLISEAAHAAAIRLPDGSDQLFDDIGCLVSHVHQHPQDGGQYWFHDTADRQWIAGGPPVFVKAPTLRTPMGGGINAFRDRESAERFAAARDGRVVNNLESLLAAGGSTR